jgi:hypothetical protein
VSRLRRKLAEVIAREMLEQHDLVVTVDLDKFAIATGFHRTDPASDAFRWTASCRIPGLQVGPVIDSYDTMTECARHGIILVKDARRAATYEATARNRN